MAEQLDILLRILTDKVGADEARNVLSKYKDEVQQTGKGMEFFNIHTRETRHLLQEIRHVSPEVGMVLRAALHPTALGIGALVIIISKIVEHMKEVKKQAEEAAKAMREVTIANWEAADKNIRAATEAIRTYNEALDTSLSKHKQIEESLNNQLARIKGYKGDEMDTLAAKQEAAQKDADAAEVEKGRLAAAKEHVIQAQKQVNVSESWLKSHPMAAALEKQAGAQAAIASATSPLGQIERAIWPKGRAEAEAEELQRKMDAANQEVETIRKAQARKREQDEKLTEAKAEAEKTTQSLKELQQGAQKGGAEVRTGLAEIEGRRAEKAGEIPQGKRTLLTAIQGAEDVARLGVAGPAGDTAIKALVQYMLRSGQSEQYINQLLVWMSDKQRSQEEKLKILQAKVFGNAR